MRPWFVLAHAMGTVAAVGALAFTSLAITRRLRIEGAARIVLAAALLEQLRASRSGWHPILDGELYGPGSFRLFGRRALSDDEAARLPDVLPSSPPPAKGRWRGPRFALPVRLDPARPVLRLRGEVTPLATPTIDVRGPGGELLARFSPRAGSFEERACLDTLVEARAAHYAVVTFESTGLDGRNGGRDLAWRSSDLALTKR